MSARADISRFASLTMASAGPAGAVSDAASCSSAAGKSRPHMGKVRQNHDFPLSVRILAAEVENPYLAGYSRSSNNSRQWIAFRKS